MSSKNSGKQPRTKKGKSKKKGNTPRLPKFDPFRTTQVATGNRVGFPANRTVNLAYVAQTSFTCTSGVPNKVQFRLNSAFDPDYTATGHQPMGFDQWSLFYNHYVVESCEYEATITPYTATPMYFGVYVSDDATIPGTDLQSMIELGSSVQQHWLYTKAPLFKGTVDIGRFMNRTGDIGNDISLRALTSANPDETVFMSLWGQPCDGSSSITSYAIVRLNMRIRFMEPKDLGASAAALPTLPTMPADTVPTPAPATWKVSPDNDDEYEFVRVKRVT